MSASEATIIAADPAKTPLKTYALGMTKYQWLVLFAAWLGWGFDVYDGLMFNYVSSNCVPTLLHIPINSPAAAKATVAWTGTITSLLLIGWAVGGIVFGKVADRIGRSRTLMWTMIIYSVGTAACAFSTNIWMLMAFRLVSALGIGGEWAAGAAMVSEVLPEKRRVEGGAILYTASAAGLFLATFVNKLIAGSLMAANPGMSWRYVFATGLIGALVALLVRRYIQEPERWKVAGEKMQSSIAELFKKEHRHATFSALTMAITALIAWWSCNAFIPVVARSLAQHDPHFAHLATKTAKSHFLESWVATATYCFTWGGLIGTLVTIPAAKLLGRKAMFFIYYALSAAALFATFSPHVPGDVRLHMYFFIGLTVYGIFGSFTYYLPELFPTRLRGTGAGFCYNAGRFVAAYGPILIGQVAQAGLAAELHAMWLIGFVPLAGMCVVPFIMETRHRNLDELDTPTSPA